MNSPTEQKLENTYSTIYNGVTIRWFIGDAVSFRRGYMNAWGSCIDKDGNIRAYQMHAFFKYKKIKIFGLFRNLVGTLTKIKVLYDPTNPYHHQETYEMLTQ